MTDKKVALVTGGSRGIGRACALELAKAGCDVVINFAGNAEAAAKTVEELKALGSNSESYKFDVSNQAEVDENKTYIEQISSRIKKLISCSDIWKTNLKICKKTLDINNDESENIDFLFKLEISDKFNINIYADKLNQSNEVLVLGNCLEYIDFIEILDNKIIKYRNELEIQKKNYQDLYLNGFMETGENIFKIEFLSKKINISRNPKYTVQKKPKKYKRKPF